MNKFRGAAIGAISLILAAPVVVRQLHRGSIVQVTAVQVGPRTVRDSVSATGSLVYEHEASLTPEVIGRVTDVLVKEGDRVGRGQVVLRIEDAPFRASVAQQQAAITEQDATIARQRFTLADAQRKLARAESLEGRGFISRANADDLRLQVSVARADLQRNLAELTRMRAILAQAVQQLSRTVIRAPIAGAVTSVSIKPGETAVPSATGIPGSSLVTVADLDTIVADLDVDESDVSRLHGGEPVAIYCPSLPDVALRGSVRSIALALRPGGLGQRAGANGRSYSVKIGFNDTRLQGLRPGMECRATIYTSSAAPQLAVPIQALRRDNDEDVDGFTNRGSSGDKTGTLFVVEQGVARQRSVRLGRSDNSYQQVLSGLRSGETVITGPYKLLRVLVPGQRVEVTKPESGQ